MAYWMVTEPIPNLWVKDRPFWYQPSRGGPIDFNLAYKGRLGANGALDSADTNMFSVGTNWFTPWRSYLEPVKSTSVSSNFFLILGDGTLLNLVTNAYSRGASALLTSEGTNYVVTFPSGNKQVYGIQFTNPATSTIRYLLSATLDAQSNRLNFVYTLTNGFAKLTRIDDFDGNQITFEYTNRGPYPALISKVIGPYKLTNYLSYSTNGQLIQIKDVVGLTSDMQYDSSNRLSHLITPYGTNVFSFPLSTNGAWQAVHVNELNLRKHLFLYGTGPTNILPSALDDYATLAELVTTAGMSERFTTNNLHERNSYYWGPRQYANLPLGVRTNIDNGTFDISLLSTNNYNIGRLRHWLTRSGNWTNFTMNTLALEREPSPDSAGNSEGLITWYDYHNKLGSGNDRDKEGRIQQPKFVASKLGTVNIGGTTRTNWYVKYAEYNSWGNTTLTAETYGDPAAESQLWRTNLYTYAANNIDLLTITHNDIVEVRNAYNNTHQVTESTNVLDEVTSYSYTANLQIDTITYPTGLVVDYTYDGSGRLQSIVEQDGPGNGIRTNSYSYTNGLILTHTDERGLTITNTWDALGRLLKVSYPDGTFITNIYDKLDIVSVLNRMGFTNGFTYNGFRQVTRFTNANHKVTTNEYCDCGSLSAAIDPLGNATTYTYDNVGQRTRIAFPGGSYTDFVYDTVGRLIRTSDSSGISATNAYTINGLLVASTNAFGRMQHIIYDVDDRPTESTDANNVTISTSYDELGRMLARTYPDTGVEKFGYSPRGLIAQTNQIAQVARYTYDVLGRKIGETNGNDVTVFKYDVSGNVTNLIDGKGQNTSWEYDQYNRLTKKIDQGNVEMFRYTNDANGRLTARWTPEKGTTAYSYDSVGNLTSINYPNSTDITLSYDANGRLTNMIDAVGTTRFTYASFGALLSEDGSWENDTVTYGYDNGRRRSSLSLLQPNASAWVQSYSYDAARRLSTLSSPAGAFTYNYFGAGSWVTNLAFPMGAGITNGYDSVGRLRATMLRTSGGTILSSNMYIYDLIGRRMTNARTGDIWTRYTYDTNNQLKTAWAYDTNSTQRVHEKFGYAYDAAGNLNYRTNDALIQTFKVNGLNQLTNVTRSGTYTVAGTTTSPATNVTVNSSAATRYPDNTFSKASLSLSDGDNTFTAVAQDNLGRNDTNAVTAYLPASPTLKYDANGNLTNDSQRVFGYDDENQLTNVMVANAWKSEFVYDGKMRRRIRREYAWQNSVWVQTNEVRYVYDGNLVIQERNNFNVPTVSYARGIDLSGSREGAGGIGGLLARTDNPVYLTSPSGAHAYYYADANGNVTTLIDTNQAIVARYVYEPFGNLFSISGTLAQVNLYRFSSKEAHMPSALVYYLYRYYDPILHRWANQDPLRDEAGPTIIRSVPIEPPSAGDIMMTIAARLDPLTMFTRVHLNLYKPLGNNPISNVDPFGLDFDDCYAKCLEDNNAPISRCIIHGANTLGNMLAGPTGRSGFQGIKSHPTTWQHKVGSRFGSIGSKVGRFVGRASIAATIADGFYNWGAIAGCAAACSDELPEPPPNSTPLPINYGGGW